MRKNLFKWSLIVALALTFTACKDENDPVWEPTDTVWSSDGAFVVGSGSNYNGIDGDLTYFDYATSKTTLKAFQGANGKSLGSNPNAGICYGSKVYLAVTEENEIKVLDKNTFKELGEIKTTNQLGATQGVKPRQLFAMNGKVYYTTYGGSNGSVAEMDTTTYTLTRSWTVGSYPEGITGTAASGNKLFVANSDYGKGNGTLSIINLDATNTATAVSTFPAIGLKNPMQVFIANGDYYVVDLGSYTSDYKQINTGLKKITETNGTYKADSVAPATMAALYNGSTFCTVSAPYGMGDVSYNLYDGKKVTPLTGVRVDSPAAMNIDPKTGNIFIASYSLVGGYASYTTNGYVREFSLDGKPVAQFVCGIAPSCIFFKTSLK